MNPLKMEVTATFLEDFASAYDEMHHTEAVRLCDPNQLTLLPTLYPGIWLIDPEGCARRSVGDYTMVLSFSLETGIKMHWEVSNV